MSDSNEENLDSLCSSLNSEKLKSKSTKDSEDLVITKARNEIKQLERLCNKLKSEVEFYQKILKLPLEDLALNSDDFNLNYKNLLLKYAEDLVIQKAFKELCFTLGKSKGLSIDDITKMAIEKEIGVLENRHNPIHNTVANNSQVIKNNIENLKPLVYKKIQTLRLNKS